MENNSGEQYFFGNQGEMAIFQGEMYGNPEMENNSGEQDLIVNQGEVAAPQGETYGPGFAHGDNAQPGENDQAPIETGSGSIGIHGPIPATTFRSRKRLTVAFGFSDGEALDIWMKSEAFWPYYSGLEENLDIIGGDGSVFPKITPRFVTVIVAIAMEEEQGARRYSQFHDIGKFIPLDLYAVFLFHAVEHNLFTPTGAFFGKNMTLEDMQVRTWQAMLRARRDNYDLRRRA
ncbi:hypothetical protein VC83_01364 [Pseudogymnoascus destructans]|uniref:Uncharacterized protein n=2 Tax=Pseudogymnoascus destructans TaxID=655981 RepID=L8G331_PSED2|nr:uncharacterized protein VC83_01364 [Pseudogymnoascus destructans]ELR07229.1 hypothetical protein GMDG_02456 [Pseudogymnoascus destructans 20631-21]OAF62040.1 hypothetical protein VC83_01364 [Pseudogymnoascus destructans]